MLRTARRVALDPMSLMTLGVASVLAETILRTTGSGAGTGVAFLLSILLIADTRGVKAGVMAAVYFAAFNNLVVVPPRHEFSTPSFNEIVLYGGALVAVFMGGQFSARRQRCPPTDDERLRDAVVVQVLADIDAERDGSPDLDGICEHLAATSHDSLESLRPVIRVLEHFDKVEPDGLCIDNDATKLVRVVISTYQRLT